MTSTLLRVSLRSSRGSCQFAAARLLSTATSVSYNYARSSPLAKPSLVLGGGRTAATRAPHVNGSHLHVSEESPKPKSDLVVVLDMDECLIHSQFFSPHAAKLAHQLPHNHASSWNFSTSSSRKVESFRFTLPDGDVVHVNKRPFLHNFLEQVCSRFETHVFTAAMEVYAAPVLDHLDPSGKMFAGRWYREHCLYQDGAYVKDLSPLGKPAHRTVLVDNNPLSFLKNPENGILVNNFYNDPEDTTLHVVLDLLEELEQVPDVRPILEKRFGLSKALEHVGTEEEEQQQQVACSFE